MRCCASSTRQKNCVTDAASSVFDAETCWPERHQQCWCFESRESKTAVTGHQYHTSNDHERMFTERSSTFSGLLRLFGSKHTQLLYIAICIWFEGRLNEIRAIIIIIIIKRGWHCKAGRERLTHYQSEDPNPTTPTHRKNEEKGKTVGDKN